MISSLRHPLGSRLVTKAIKLKHPCEEDGIQEITDVPQFHTPPPCRAHNVQRMCVLQYFWCNLAYPFMHINTQHVVDQ